ncbi:zinc metalloproteinase nas-7-like [Brevipalpus obovatus]|uniref:zinc metalloproteinase nas-7-like n=1 Tax=Brevipalpus obovatus TaxID=246614 RepID=UPI003D9E7833
MRSSSSAYVHKNINLIWLNLILFLLCSPIIMINGGHKKKASEHKKKSKGKVDPDAGKPLSSTDFKHADKLDEKSSHLDNKMLYSLTKFEGDIEFGGKKRMKSAISNKILLWPKGEVKYSLSRHYSSKDRAAIAKAMKRFHRQTCIKFKPKVEHDSDYLYIRPAGGCWSFLGRYGGMQTLSLGEGCVHPSIVQHELMHALGFYHEQSRYDRDKYIKIIWHNIRRGAVAQFRKATRQEMDTLGEKYDYQSIMHYPAKAFSNGGGPTIVARKKGVQIGMAKKADAIDIRKINKLYKCPGKH